MSLNCNIVTTRNKACLKIINQFYYLLGSDMELDVVWLIVCDVTAVLVVSVWDDPAVEIGGVSVVGVMKCSRTS